MKDAERLLDSPLDVVKVLDYGKGATHDVMLVARPDDPETRYVVKRARGEPGPLYREHAALVAYGEHDASRALVPGVVAVSDDWTLLVVDALPFTESDRLGVILEGDDGDRARAALLAHVRALAVLNGVPARVTFIGHMIFGGRLPPSRHAVNGWHLHLAALGGRLEGLGGTATGVVGETAEADDVLGYAGRFASVSHGDGTAANTFVTTEGRAHVIDFETADTRHALIDGVFGSIRYLSSVWALEIPPALRIETALAFRETYAGLVPAAADDGAWRVAETAAAAAWLSILLRRPDRYLEHDRRWGRAGLRWRVFTGLERFVEIARESDCMPATAAACERAITHLRAEWPEEHRTCRSYRAFAQA